MIMPVKTQYLRLISPESGRVIAAPTKRSKNAEVNDPPKKAIDPDLV